MLEKIKKDKLKAATIIVSIVVFIAGIIVTAASTSDTYAATYKCYQCNSPQFFLWTATPSSSQCPAGWRERNDLTESTCKTAATYTITYNANGGSGAPSSQTKTEGVSLQLSNTKPTRSGYTFLGWSTSNSATTAMYSAGGTYTKDASATLYAVWKSNYKCYQCNGTGEFKWTASPSSSECPSGWHERSDLTQSECKNPTKYMVIYDANGGSDAPSSQEKVEGTDLKLSTTIPTRSGYTFKGWAISSTATTATYQAGDWYTKDEPITLYAVWEYASKCYQCNSDSNLVVYTSSTPSNSDCKSWVVNTDLTPYQCTSAKYILNPNGGSGGPGYFYKRIEVDVTVPTATPTLAGYKFIKWSVDPLGAADKYDVLPGGVFNRDFTQGTTLYAIYEKYNCYECNGSNNIREWSTSTPSSSSCPSGWHINSNLNQTQCVTKTHSCWECNSPSTIKEWSLDQPSDSNCGSGWHINSNVGESSCSYYYIHYNANGGTGAPSSQYASKATDVTIPTTIPTREGYTFVGWATSSTATASTYKPGYIYSSGKSVTLYAVWTDAKCYQCNGTGDFKWTSSPSSAECPSGWHDRFDLTQLECKNSVKHVVTYDANGGSGAPSSQLKEEDIDLKLSTTIPTRNGFTFLGWSTDKNAITAEYPAGGMYKINEPVMLYAVWKAGNAEEGYDVIYYINGGTYTGDEYSDPDKYEKYLADQSAFYGERYYVYTLEDFPMERNGHTFSGWKDEDGKTVASGWHESWPYDRNVTLTAQWTPISGGGNGGDSGDDIGGNGGNTGGEETPKTYTVRFDSNGGSGSPSSQVKTEKITLILNNRQPERVGYKFISWNTKQDGTGTSYNPGGKYEKDEDIILYAQWELDSSGDNPGAGGSGDNSGGNDDGNEDVEDIYYIDYDLRGGVITGNPSSAKKDEVVTINNPSKVITIFGNDNKTGAKITDNVTIELGFAGWTSFNINTNLAYYDETPWSDGNKKVTAIYFKNLTDVGKTATLEANWNDAETELPIVTKEGYTCKWNTKSDGSGTTYYSGDKYIVKGNDSSINLYAICIEDPKTDEELEEGPTTGSVLIYIVWTIGLGALGYTVYYFGKNKIKL